jgi:hypothetical protein
MFISCKNANNLRIRGGAANSKYLEKFGIPCISEIIDGISKFWLCYRIALCT